MQGINGGMSHTVHFPPLYMQTFLIPAVTQRNSNVIITYKRRRNEASM